MYSAVPKDYLSIKTKFITDDYLHMYKTLQLFTKIFTLDTNIFTSIKVIKKHICTGTKVIKNAELMTAWIKLKLLIVLGLLK